ncbi:uncharacterized protein CBL_07673 [Carabus blaptoides fortunei]
MTNKNSIDEILSQFFGDEISNSPVSSVVDAGEEWLDNSQKSLQDFLQDISPADNNVTSLSTAKHIQSSPLFNPQHLRDSEFEQLFRMTRSTFADLQRELALSSINESKLLLCLWILGNTKSFGEIASLFRIKQESVYDICEKCFAEIIDLSANYVTWPNDTEVLALEKGFLCEFKFPGVVGVVASLHIAVYVAEDDPKASTYFNKGAKHHTIVLQAVCDNNYLFRDIFAGYPGSNSIKTILEASPVYVKLKDDNSYITKSLKHLLGGTEHPQLPTLLTPYSIPKYRKSSARELKFNALHGSVMCIVEKTFRMVENRFQRMRSLDTASPQFATLAAGAICVALPFPVAGNYDEDVAAAVCDHHPCHAAADLVTSCKGVAQFRFKYRLEQDGLCKLGTPAILALYSCSLV